VTADFVKHRGMRRAQCILGVAMSFLISQLVGLRVQQVEQLQYAVMLVGVSYGAVYGLIPIITLEWFGIGLYNSIYFCWNCKNANLLSGFHSFSVFGAVS
jgi:hypothetical protein